MKKVLIKTLALLLLVCCVQCLFIACEDNPISFKLNFIVDNEIVKTIDTAGNETITLPENPVKNGYTFDGWFWDKDVWGKPFTANSLLDAPLSSDMSVYAKFTKNHEHNYTAVVTEPTCTEKGYTTYTCDCGESYVDNYTNALDHEFTNYVYDNNATYDSDGTKTAVCNRDCGATNTIAAENTKLIAVEYLTLNNNELFMIAGETDNLSTTITPNNATNQEIIWNSNHPQIVTVENGIITAIEKGTAIITATSVNGIVTECQVNVCSNSFTYTVNDGKACITGYKDTTATMLVIPNEINSFPVKTIGKNAFKDKTMLKNIIIREGIEILDDHAFDNCNSLEKIYLPNSLEQIRYDCFKNCRQLKEITIPDNIQKIYAYAFLNCYSLQKIYFNAIYCVAVPTNVEINYCIFSNISDYQVSVIVGQNVTAIDGEIFTSSYQHQAIKNFVFASSDNWFYYDNPRSYPRGNKNYLDNIEEYLNTIIANYSFDYRIIFLKEGGDQI